MQIVLWLIWTAWVVWILAAIPVLIWKLWRRSTEHMISELPVVAAEQVEAASDSQQLPSSTSAWLCMTCDLIHRRQSNNRCPKCGDSGMLDVGRILNQESVSRKLKGSAVATAIAAEKVNARRFNRSRLRRIK